MPLRNLLKSKILISKHYHVTDKCILDWAFWLFEEEIKIINEISAEEAKEQKKQEEAQKKSNPSMKSTPNYLKGFGKGGKKFK